VDPTDIIDSPARGVILGLSFDAWTAAERKAAIDALIEEEARRIAPGAEIVLRALRECMTHKKEAPR